MLNTKLTIQLCLSSSNGLGLRSIFGPQMSRKKKQWSNLWIFEILKWWVTQNFKKCAAISLSRLAVAGWDGSPILIWSLLRKSFISFFKSWKKISFQFGFWMLALILLLLTIFSWIWKNIYIQHSRKRLQPAATTFARSPMYWSQRSTTHMSGPPLLTYRR